MSDEQKNNGEENACENCQALQEQFDQLQKQADEYKAGWMRANADYQNLQKEVAREKGDWIRMSEMKILDEFLPVYDNFKKAMTHTNFGANETNDDTNSVNTKFENWKKGIEYIMKQFADILKAHGIVEMKTVGEMFDPTRHEALGEEEAETAKENEIVREIDSGYLMGDKVIKVAKVIVAKKKD